MILIHVFTSFQFSLYMLFKIKTTFQNFRVQPNDLHVILKELKRIPQIKSIKRNIFDGRQIATYIYANFSD